MRNKLLSLALPGLLLPCTTATAATILTLPEGVESHIYSRSATAIRPYGYGSLIDWTEAGIIADVATDNSRVYVRNLVGNYTHGYLEGTINDNTAVFTLPQTIEWNGTEVRVVGLQLDETEETYRLNPEATQIEFTFNDGKFTVSDPDYVLGMIDDNDAWVGYAYRNINLHYVDTTVAEAPADGEECNMAVKYEIDRQAPVDPFMYGLFNAIVKDNNIFLRGLDTNCPDSWIKGEIKDNEVVFTSGQYLGVAGETLLYFCTALDSPELIPGYNTWEHHYSLTESLTMNYDAAKGVITPRDSNDALLVNSGSSEASPYRVYRNAILTAQPLEVSPVPAQPEFRKGENEYINSMGSCMMNFLQRPFNKDGQYIDPANLGFTVYSNNEPYIFSASEYWLDEDMTVVPWGYDNWWIESYSNGFTNLMLDYSIPNLNIRAVYREGDKEYYSTPLDPLNPQSGIEVITGNNSKITYFDLSGREITNPKAGLYIKVIDGRATKVIIN